MSSNELHNSPIADTTNSAKTIKIESEEVWDEIEADVISGDKIRAGIAFGDKIKAEVVSGDEIKADVASRNETTANPQNNLKPRAKRTYKKKPKKETLKSSAKLRPCSMGLNLKNTAKSLDESLDPEIRRRYMEVTMMKKEISTANFETRPVLEKELIKMKLNYCHLCRIPGDPPTEYFDLISEFQDHFAVMHSKRKWSIYCCCSEHAGASAAFDHVRWHMDSEAFKCPFCDDGVNRKHMQLLLTHINRVHLPKIESLSCPKCNAQFIIPQKLEYHMKTPCLHKCPICSKEFKLGHLQKHIDSAHEKRPTKTNHFCDTCGAGYQGRVQLDRHMAIHDPNRKKVPCDVCGLLVFDVNDHKSRVHGPAEEPSICIHCGKQFKNLLRMKSHVYNVHREKKFFPCSVCDKRFTLKRYRKEHMSTHSGVPLYPCYFCEEEFSYLTTRTTHHRKAHAEAYAEYKKKKFVSLSGQPGESNDG